jgi:N-acetylneuraminic acid mutarotase
MGSDRRFVTTATVGTSGGGSFLYAIGGQSVNASQFCSGQLSKVEAYNGNTNTWSTKAPLPLPLMSSLAGTINGKIYLVGGCTSTVRPREETWEYDVSANRWTQKALAPITMPSPAGAVLGGKLWIFDTCESSEFCFAPGGSTFFGFYDPAANQWTRLPRPPLAVFPIEGAALKGKLYFINSDGQLHIFNPNTGAWTTGARRNNRQTIDVTSAVVAGKWYVVGKQIKADGTVGAGFLSVYNPANNSWTTRAAPPAAYLTHENGPVAGRVFADGVARLDLVGGRRPNNHWQFTP